MTGAGTAAFVEARETGEQLAAVPARVDGPCLVNIVAAGRTPPLTITRAAELGYRLAIFPVLMLAAVIAAGDAALRGLAETGDHPDGVPVMPVAEIFARAGAGGWDELRRRYEAG
jgi:2-methylisocitrate lyase-like PEP mutase family enzyme